MVLFVKLHVVYVGQKYLSTAAQHRNNNNSEQLIEKVQYLNKGELIHFSYPLTHCQGHCGVWAALRKSGKHLGQIACALQANA